MKRSHNFVFLTFLLYSFFSCCEQVDTNRFLIFGGKSGWIGQKLVTMLGKQGYQVFVANSRLENREQIEQEIAHIRPTIIINAAGITGRPTVTWCESNREETIRANVLGLVNLIDIAYMYKIHVTNLATGCIYHYNETHTMDSGVGFKEDDEPNFDVSFYSKTKIFAEKLILLYPNVLNLRVRMPISSDLHPKSFVGKIIHYKKVVNVQNSMTILDDLLPLIIDMSLKGIKGNYNFVNPGTISHHQILTFYKKYIDSNHTYEPLTLENHDKSFPIRSNCELDSSKLLKLYPTIPHVQKSIEKLFQSIATKRDLADTPILIFTYSYNRPDFIELQHKTLKKFLKDSYKFIVFNDAVDPSNEQAILNACRHLDIECVRVPQEIHTLPYLPRWPYEPPNYPTVRCVNNIQYSLNKFGFNHNGIVVILDSDLFLIKPLSFTELLKDYDIFGGLQRHFPSDGNKARWVDHFGIHCLALNMKTLPNRHSLNVNCGTIDEVPVDAGGHTSLYLKQHPSVRIIDANVGGRNISVCNITAETLKSWRFNENEICFLTEKFGFPINVDFFFYNHFLHYRSGTNWDQKPDEYHQQKTELIQKFINKISE